MTMPKSIMMLLTGKNPMIKWLYFVMRMFSNSTKRKTKHRKYLFNPSSKILMAPTKGTSNLLNSMIKKNLYKFFKKGSKQLKSALKTLFWTHPLYNKSKEILLRLQQVLRLSISMIWQSTLKFLKEGVGQSCKKGKKWIRNAWMSDSKFLTFTMKLTEKKKP